MVEKVLRIVTLAAAALAMVATPLFAQSASPPTGADKTAKPVVPSREDYPDAGQAFGMIWHYTNYDNNPNLAFEVPETDNLLWNVACEKQKNGSIRIANQIMAKPKELVAEDRFGFTVRVDDGQSIGVLARMLPVNIEGEEYHMPQFYLPNSHSLFRALAQGSRAYVNLNGNKFSMHLNGSGTALTAFLKACQ
ncbi:MAG: hypothetical protein V7676_08075 [Parasphingorhabdus sp.]|uniref:hypothetical protein n=1 Tax=Parasphingorhabdus sp. TaxID=2709688 RepID=UPI0030019CC1